MGVTTSSHRAASNFNASDIPTAHSVVFLHMDGMHPDYTKHAAIMSIAMQVTNRNSKMGAGASH